MNDNLSEKTLKVSKNTQNMTSQVIATQDISATTNPTQITPLGALNNHSVTTIRTTCPYCGVGCGVLAQVDTAGTISVTGDPEHPAN